MSASCFIASIAAFHFFTYSNQITTTAFVPPQFVKGKSSVRSNKKVIFAFSDVQAISQIQSDKLPAFQTSNVATSPTQSLPTFSAPMIGMIKEWLKPEPAYAADLKASTQPKPPTTEEVDLLRGALGALYGEKNPVKAEPMLNQAIIAWERQNPDEQAALYRVRGDCYMQLLQPDKAITDYTQTIKLLQSPGGELADPSELPSSYLGRARAIRSLPTKPLTKDQATMSANDYRTYLKLNARGDDEDFDSDMDRIEDGAARNPYAAWEWGAALRSAGDFNQAFQARILASDNFDLIGDKPRSVIAELDAAIDLAIIASDSPSDSANADAKQALETAISKTTKVSSRDVKLLQRVIAKEGEARIALASILWDMPGEKAGAEAQLGESCLRLEQLDADQQQRTEGSKGKQSSQPLEVQSSFSIDDGLGAGEINCSRFKNEKFLTESLDWPESLQRKTIKLQKLGKK